ncbi:MAG: RecQ family ATP-dependent DNA helicase [candidate division Zixibacteria bacterium]|nr:RecQ family ATP-dependent DNA helicase [candidate division Zixibacteria bacterium]
MNGDKYEHALDLLRLALGDSQALFREGQWEAIHQLVYRKSRLLVVQRTGWGKSIVYFLATRLLRDDGAGATVLVSPLLALMRNQILAAERTGLRAATINSSNVNEWNQVQQELAAGRVDILLVSPERLANDNFCARVLAPLASKAGLFVVDEAHCISDWGHDFRPDYRRIPQVLKAMPRSIPILATTATANNRVVEDIISQLASGLVIQRGPLERESLRLQNIVLPGQAARLAWLAEHLPPLPGSGIIYTLTIEDARRVARWLQMRHINAHAYWGALETEQRKELEQQLLDNEIKALVATSALGMGFDKPDIGFVIHFQRPGSAIHYYQQVGRAGRAVPLAFGILLCGAEDDEITDYFIRSAMPSIEHVGQVLDALKRASAGLTVSEIETQVNIRRSEIDKVLSLLAVESPAPILKIDTRWRLQKVKYCYDTLRATQLLQIKRAEQTRMREYMRTQECLMAFLKRELDDPDARPCGRCANCIGQPLLSESCSETLVTEALRFLQHCPQRIEPRKRWPIGAFVEHNFKGSISATLNMEAGRSLCRWGDAGWGDKVRRGKQLDCHFDDELVNASLDLIRIDWQPRPFPKWVTCVPSLNNRTLVPDFALRLARELRLPFVPCVIKAHPTEAQKLRSNSFQQAHNLDGAFRIDDTLVKREPVLLVDDMVDSRWTMTVVAALLRQAGSGPVFPFALAVTTSE